MYEVRYERTGRTATYRLTGAGAAERGAVSARSPVGTALLGCRAGEQVGVELPDGRTEHLTVVRVVSPPA